jgi:sulfoxide reductase heme-binding subunit YedZ
MLRSVTNDKKISHSSILTGILNIAVPAALFFLFFYLYSLGKVTQVEMVKTTGLWALSLLGITLIVGPISRFVPGLQFLRANRKFWGITSFFIALTHLILVMKFYFPGTLAPFLNIYSSKFTGVMSGLTALVLLAAISLTSTKRVAAKLPSHAWKRIQTASYLVLFLAILHFYNMESFLGVLIIKRLLGKIAIIFSLIVIFVRLLIVLF